MQSRRHLISTQAEAERLAQEKAAAEAKASDEADRLAAEAAKASDEADKEAKEAEEKADEAEEAVERETEGEGVPRRAPSGWAPWNSSAACSARTTSRAVAAAGAHVALRGRGRTLAYPGAPSHSPRAPPPLPPPFETPRADQRQRTRSKQGTGFGREIALRRAARGKNGMEPVSRGAARGSSD